MAAEATAQRVVTRISRQLESKVRKYGPGVLLALRGAIAPVALAAAVYGADRLYAQARMKALAKVVDQYRYTMAAIPPGKRAANQLKMANWLRRELEKVNRSFDSRGIEERQGY